MIANGLLCLRSWTRRYSRPFLIHPCPKESTFVFCSPLTSAINIHRLMDRKKLVPSMVTHTTSMASALQTIEMVRHEANRQLDPKQKSALGQFMTPSVVAKYMASLFATAGGGVIRLLDPGAGVGSLTAAFLQRFMEQDGVNHIHATAYEIDAVMQSFLRGVLGEYGLAAEARGVCLSSEVIAVSSPPRKLFQ